MVTEAYDNWTFYQFQCLFRDFLSISVTIVTDLSGM